MTTNRTRRRRKYTKRRKSSRRKSNRKVLMNHILNINRRLNLLTNIIVENNSQALRFIQSMERKLK